MLFFQGCEIVVALLPQFGSLLRLVLLVLNVLNMLTVLTVLDLGVFCPTVLDLPVLGSGGIFEQVEGRFDVSKHISGAILSVLIPFGLGTKRLGDPLSLSIFYGLAVLCFSPQFFKIFF